MNLKKIIYILFSLLIGFVLYCVTYAEYEYEFRLNMIENALKDNKYDDIAKIYETFFDSKSKVEDISDETDFMIYPSTYQTAIQYSDGINHIDYEMAYSFYLFNNTFSLESKDQKNKSAIRFITDSGHYDFYFVVNTGINTEILISEPATIEQALINVGRDYSINNRELGFINITFTQTMLDGITKLANGKDGTGNINKIVLLDSNGQSILEHKITFDYQDQFFIDNGEMIESFNEVYEKYKETDDPFEQERIEEEFNQTLEEWTVKFNESNHPTYRLGFSEDDLTSKEIFNKTLVVMIIYVIVDVLLYILLFYWQNLMDLIIKVFKLKAPAGWEYREKK